MFVNFALKVENNEYVLHESPTVTPVSDSITYEQPLLERMRLFMRLEELMHRFQFAVQGNGGFETHFALTTLIEILDLTNRVDLKRELMKELERQIANLSRLTVEPSVDQDRLTGVIDQQRRLIEQIHTINGQLDQQIKSNDFFGSIRQRNAIPGGTCDFDLPAYHYWLSRPVSERRTLLKEWSAPFHEIHEAVRLVLKLLRNSAEPRKAVARQGFYEQSLDGSIPWQMIRISLPADNPCYPEISAGRQRFSVRLLKPGDMRNRAKQCDQDVSFELTCCAI
ncbi:cell division protein ZapD [Thioalkalivibrio sulfidiphilus]|uniref:cell division protein ZapD n=1 Tax=Thioalkalivibrio sulfidiphilus TaxID=1033854 RepID=UPI003BAE5F06